jgi:hypothetical protein
MSRPSLSKNIRAIENNKHQLQIETSYLNACRNIGTLNNWLYCLIKYFALRHGSIIKTNSIKFQILK